ncbi:MAG: hypothetical protein ORN83_06400 [Chthoniobacteraceae bacterium]|nr:hypothetical protein [Chthoniobacteraceae bacterium]
MSFWTKDEIKTLNRLRDGFLAGNAGAADYWSSEEELGLYEKTFAQRIGWKWDAVLSELSLRDWSPPSTKLVDWACGSGIAGLRTLEHWPEAFTSITVTDRSYRARNFAVSRLREKRGDLAVEGGNPEQVDCGGAVVLVSHLLTELSERELRDVLERFNGASALLWVESATRENARRLMAAVRGPLLASGEWKAVAPCTHSGSCPLLQGENERHWCHHFARVPSEVHQDEAWRDFSERVGVDLRVLPYTFVVLERGTNAQLASNGENGLSRVIGTAREFKGFLKVLSCAKDGVNDWTLQKRDVPATFKALRKGGELPLFRFETQGDRVVKAERSGAQNEP